MISHNDSKELVKILREKSLEELETTDLLDKLIEKYHFVFDSDFFDALLEAKGIEIVDKYGDQILNSITSIPVHLRDNQYLFDKCLELGKFNLIFDFDGDFFTREIIDKYVEPILNHLNQIPYTLEDNEYLLDKCLELGKFNLIFDFEEDLFTRERIDKYGDQILNLCDFIPHNMKRNQYLFEKCLELGKFNLIVDFDGNSFTKKVINKHGETILNHLDYIPSKMKYNEYLFEKCMKIGNLEFASQFKFNKDVIKDSKVFEIYAKALNITTDELKRKLDYLYDKNDEILDTIRVLMLSNDMNLFEIKDIERLSIYEDIQTDVLKLNINQKNLFSKIMKYLNNFESEYDITPVIFNLLNNYKNYPKLMSSILDKDLNDEEMKNLISILQLERNYYNINNISELNNNNLYKLKTKKKIEIMNQIKTNSNDIVGMKKYLLLEKFGINMSKAKFICERYCSDFESLNESNISENTKKILQEIYLIYNSHDLNMLNFYFLTSTEGVNNFCDFEVLESIIRSEYAKLYSDSLYKVQDNHKMQKGVNVTDKEYEILNSVEYNGNKPQIYIVDGDFNMQIHVLGAYNSWFDTSANFKDDWLRPKIQYHGICTSYIGNNQIANAGQVHPAIAFDQYESSALLLAGNYDLYSDLDILSNYATSLASPYKFYDPKNMIDKTRYTHNEMVIERRNNNQNKSFKRMPSYVVYFAEDLTKIEEHVNDDLFKETVQASIDFDVPMVIVDRLKYAETEYIKIINAIEQFEEKPSVEKIKDIITNYCNNMVGCRYYDGDARYEYHNVFSERDLQNIIDDLYSYIKNLNNADLKDITKEELLFNLKALVDNEKENSKGSLNISLNDFIPDYSPKKDSLEDIINEVALYYQSANNEIKEAIKKDMENLSTKEIRIKINNGGYDKLNFNNHKK